MPLISIKGRLKKITDENLLSMYIEHKNMDVLGELYGRHMHLVYGLCLKYLKNRDEAKDAVIKIFEKISADVFKFEIKNFKGWLYVVSRNFCLMELRKLKSKSEVQLTENISVFMENDVDIHPIDREDIQEELRIALNNCIERLKTEQKDVIKLFYFENKCYHEIAEHLDIEEKKVKSYIQNGKRNLKICLENKNVRSE